MFLWLGRMAVTPVRTGPRPRRSGPDDGGMPDQHPFDVGDGVPLSGLEAPERDPQLPGAHTLLHARALSRLLPERHRGPAVFERDQTHPYSITFRTLPAPPARTAAVPTPRHSR